MAKLASIRALLACEDDDSAASVIEMGLQPLGPLLLDCKVDAVLDYEVPTRESPAGVPGAALDVVAGPDAVHVALREGHLQLATDQRVVMDFGAGHFSAHLDDATHIARCLNAHHRLVAALRDAMHHLTLQEAGQQTPMSSAQMIELLGQALRVARTPAVIETGPAPGHGPAPRQARPVAPAEGVRQGAARRPAPIAA